MEIMTQNGFNYNKLKFIGLVILAILIIDYILGIFKNRTKSKKIEKNIWGKTPNRKYINSDFVALSDFFLYKTGNNEFVHVIDDIIWNDIDMNKVFAKINNTLSTLGSNILYFMLRTPVFSEEILIKRDRYIDFFCKI